LTDLSNQCFKDFTPYGWYSSLRLAEMFVEDMNLSFDHVGDDMPSQNYGLEQRPKLIHSVGLVAET